MATEIGSESWLRERFPDKDWHRHPRTDGRTDLCDGTPSDCASRPRSSDRDAAHVMNVIAEAVQSVLGEEEPDGSRPGRPFLPLSVRYGAAEAAVRVVIAWKEKGVAPEWPAGPPHYFDRGPDGNCSACGAAEDKAIHDAGFAQRRGVQLVAAETFRQATHEGSQR